MDGDRFDRVTRDLAIRKPRRSLLGLLAGSALGLSLLGKEDVEGKKKKKKAVTLCHEGQTISVSGKAKKDHLKHGDALGPCASPPPPPPGSACAVGQKPCQGRCIPSNQCCVNSDCAPGAPRCCNGTCIRPNECCGDSECPAGNVCQTGSCVCAPANICGNSCCVAPAGIPVAEIDCIGADQCMCRVRPSEACAPGCDITDLRGEFCDQLAGTLADICESFNCEAP